MLKLVFLDRDGVLNKLVDSEELRAPRNIKELEICEGASEAVFFLSKAGYRIVVVTNQPDVSRNLNSVQNVLTINAQIKSEIPQISKFEVCFHDDSDFCTCRKPKSGLFVDYLSESLDQPRDIWMIGDRDSDIQAGKSVQAKTILILAENKVPNNLTKPDFTANNLLEASKIILELGSSTNFQ